LSPPPSSSLFPYTTLFRSLLITPVLTLHSLPHLHRLKFPEKQVRIRALLNSSHPSASPSYPAQLIHFCRPALHKSSRNDMAEPRSEEHTSELQSRFDLVCR